MTGDAQHPRGCDVSKALTEVRTVLSRAGNARATLNRPTEGRRVAEGHWEEGTPQGRRWVPGRWEPYTDPDAAEMRADLDKVIAILERWRRTGRRPGGEATP